MQLKGEKEQQSGAFCRKISAKNIIIMMNNTTHYSAIANPGGAGERWATSAPAVLSSLTKHHIFPPLLCSQLFE